MSSVSAAAPALRPDDIQRLLAGRPTLSELRDVFPREWKRVERELQDVASGRRTLEEYVASLRPTPHKRVPQPFALAREVRRAMAVAAIREAAVGSATGVDNGRVRFNLVNGWAAQRLLFRGSGFERKPVSLRRFRIVWPLLWQRRYLMPLVAAKGIYCFYSAPLMDRIAALIGDRSCLEIAAGDGTLTRFLLDRGVDVKATDDHSWSHAIRFPDAVARLDARAALRHRKPQAVICSWPPAGNDFEQAVFRTPSVQLYIVIASRHRFAAGAWDDYERQQAFDWAEAPELSRLVLPPELDAAVYVFRRR